MQGEARPLLGQPTGCIDGKGGGGLWRGGCVASLASSLAEQ